MSLLGAFSDLKKFIKPSDSTNVSSTILTLHRWMEVRPKYFSFLLHIQGNLFLPDMLLNADHPQTTLRSSHPLHDWRGPNGAARLRVVLLHEVHLHPPEPLPGHQQDQHPARPGLPRCHLRAVRGEVGRVVPQLLPVGLSPAGGAGRSLLQPLDLLEVSGERKDSETGGESQQGFAHRETSQGAGWSFPCIMFSVDFFSRFQG